MPWLILYAAFFALHFAGLATQQPWLIWLTKPFPVLFLAGWVAVNATKDAYRTAILAGFLFSVAGDVFLMFHPPARETQKLLFLLGLASFLIAHLCYIRAFLQGKPALRPERLLPPLAAVATMAAVITPGLGPMALPVYVYMAVITTMVWRAAARIGHGGELSHAQWLGFIGACVFMLSDSMIAWNKFASPIPGERYLIMATYWAGQLGIALSARRLATASLSPESQNARNAA